MTVPGLERRPITCKLDRDARCRHQEVVIGDGAVRRGTERSTPLRSRSGAMRVCTVVIA